MSADELHETIAEAICDKLDWDCDDGVGDPHCWPLADAVLALPDVQRLFEAEATVRRVLELLDPDTEMATVVFRTRMFAEADLRRALLGDS